MISTLICLNAINRMNYRDASPCPRLRYLQYKIDVQSQILMKKNNYRDAIPVALVNWLHMYVGTLKHWLDAMNPLKIVVLLRISECHLNMNI